ncbi:MAG: poly-gamma-glutamate hydrolase family protein [Acidimicrobiia bacterium]|nr:poly-gamma-glutamate hydrolase family protein [Acidimicrobiia bacterium]
MLDNLLSTPGVEEIVQLRSTFGFMAFHGGGLEKVTDIVAAEAAERSDASYYGVLHPDDIELHVPSKHFDPAHSPGLASFLDHVDVVVAIHGYGRKHLRWDLLLGGTNRPLAGHVAGHLRSRLPPYRMIVELDQIPPELAGQHPDNPVNRVRNAGVQIELPPLVRWYWEKWEWSDHGDAGRAPQVEALILGLAESARAWVPEGDLDGWTS